MSRSKKTRSLKSVVSLKTGSKSKILDEEGNRGRIPSKNKLSKHKKKPKSAYAKSLSEKSKSNEPAIKQAVPHPFKEALKQKALEESEALKSQQPKAIEPKVKAQPKKAEATKPATRKEKDPAPVKKAKETKQSKGFNDLDGDELLDFFEQF